MPDISSLPTPTTAPVLSTPDERIFEINTPSGENVPLQSYKRKARSEEELSTIYEIERTVLEIQAGGWRRIALQFPDHLLHDAAWVSRNLGEKLREVARSPSLASLDLNSDGAVQAERTHEKKIFILADTSYGACCVDEVAAEHADADVVVHYGRACLSPTARLPVIYCFTRPPLSTEDVVEVFKEVYPDLNQKIVLMSDLPYNHVLPLVGSNLTDLGYKNIFVTDVVHDTASALPNRTVPAATTQDKNTLRGWALFHIAEPSPSLLLTLTSRVSSIHVLPIPTLNDEILTKPLKATEMSTSTSLRRRYAMLTSLTTVPIFGIIVNTLSVRDYMGILRHVKATIAAAGKKSYTFVVGKVNAAKVANFSEVGGWVVIGCWESSLFESGEFWKPMITPFELEVALRGDGERVWTGNWTGDFQALLRRGESGGTGDDGAPRKSHDAATKIIYPDLLEQRQPHEDILNDPLSSEEESEPPEYDLRTGRYVSQTRPTRPVNPPTTTSSPNVPQTNSTTTTSATPSSTPSQTLTKKPQISVLTSPSTSDAAFPAAAFFRDKRSWQGLGSDFEVKYDDDGALVPEEGAVVEQGRAGIARGYRVGEEGGEVT